MIWYEISPRKTSSSQSKFNWWSKKSFMILISRLIFYPSNKTRQHCWHETKSPKNHFCDIQNNITFFYDCNKRSWCKFAQLFPQNMKVFSQFLIRQVKCFAEFKVLLERFAFALYLTTIIRDLITKPGEAN